MASPRNMRILKIELRVTDLETGADVKASELDEAARDYIRDVCLNRLGLKYDRDLVPSLNGVAVTGSGSG